MEQSILALGMLIVIIGIIVIAAGSLMGGKGKSEFAVGGFIGPIPFGFASSREMLYMAVGLTVILLIAAVFWFR